MNKKNILELNENIDHLPLSFYFVQSMVEERNLGSQQNHKRVDVPNDSFATIFYQTEKREIFSFYKPIRVNF